MASDYEQPISDQEKMRIASDFILHSPPGEFNEVFNDVRFLLDNDELLKESAGRASAQYNKSQQTPVRIEGSDHLALITEFNDLGGGRFLDPRSKKTFYYDHLRKDASNFEQQDDNVVGETWRKSLEQAFTNYVTQHHKHGVSSVFLKSDGNSITLTACTEDHQFQPKNFWNGRWRSQWSVTFSPTVGGVAEIKGILKVQVHYYEDGNVQLVTSKEIKENLTISNEQETAVEFCRLVEESENDYQTAISENYQTMSDTTFKALRRQLPVTRTKFDWNKILNYRIGSELKSH